MPIHYLATVWNDRDVKEHTVLTRNDWKCEKIPQSALRHSKGKWKGCKRDMKDDLHSRASPAYKK